MSTVHLVIADSETGADVEVFGSKKRAEEYAVDLALSENLKVSRTVPNFLFLTGELITIDGQPTGISVVEKEIRRAAKAARRQ